MAKNAENLVKNEQNVTKKTKKEVKKARSWATVIYPESMPDNWEQIIRLSGLKCALSPLHDKDLNADDEEKKAHYHLIFIWNKGSTTLNNARRFVKSLNGAEPQALESIRGYYRYFTHKDNPEKYQYNESDIKVFNGFDINDYVEKTKSENLQIKKELIKYIQEHKIYYYDVLIMETIQKNLNDFFDVASNNTLFFTNFLQSKRHRRVHGYQIEMKEIEEELEEEKLEELLEKLEEKKMAAARGVGNATP